MEYVLWPAVWVSTIVTQPALNFCLRTAASGRYERYGSIGQRAKLNHGPTLVQVHLMHCKHYEDEQDEVQVQSHCAQAVLGVLRTGHPSPLSPRS